MRATVGILLAIVVLFGGFVAISYAGQSAEETALNGTNASADAFNFTTELYNVTGQVVGPGLVWLGIGAVILIAAAYLVYAAQAGR